MSSLKIVFGVALIALSCFSFGHSLQCYICNSKESCKSAVQYECDSSLADKTTTYLKLYYSGNDLNTKSNSYNCLTDNLDIGNGNHYYKGCTYDYMDVCNLNIDGRIGRHSRLCNQCNGIDGCNPAGFVNINILTVFALVIVVLIGVN